MNTKSQKPYHKPKTRFTIIENMIREAREEVIRLDIELSILQERQKQKIDMPSIVIGPSIEDTKEHFDYWLFRLEYLKELKKKRGQMTEEDIAETVAYAKQYPEIINVALEARPEQDPELIDVEIKL